MFEMAQEPIQLLFWGALIFISYTYFGYPLLLLVWSNLFPKSQNKRELHKWPTVSIVISAKDEENTIGQRLENLLQCEYSPDKLQVIVVSDGSVDQTCERVESFITAGKDRQGAEIILISLNKSNGKPNGLNLGVQQAKGDIVVFTDARQKFKSDAIIRLVENFSDPLVGCVSGELFFVEHENSTIGHEMGMYWKLEKCVRKMESKIDSVVGATGAIYAIQKRLFEKMKPELLLDDVFIPMQVVKKGYRSVFDSRAQAYDVPSRDSEQEWLRKKRTLAGCWQLLSIEPSLMLPWKNPLWFRFFSHKIFRLLVPFALLLLLTTSFTLHGWLFQLTFMGQVIFYLIALIGWLVPQLRSVRLINLAFFFVMLNLAAMSGYIYWITGKCDSVWK